MKKQFVWICLTLIVALAAYLRLTHLSQVPPGVNRDEASIGYTAYSLIQTGRDEYGQSWPLSFQSFGDWKLPLYIYLTIPFVKIFGLTEIAVRLPSALAGIATVIMTYFVVLRLFNKNYILALIAAGLLAISPWHLHLSRVESESNLAVFLITSGLLLYLKNIYFPAFLLFGLTYYTYHGNHVTTTLLVLGLMILLSPKDKRKIWLPLILFVIMVGFIMSKTLISADRTKISGISIFGDPAVIHIQIELPRLQYPNPDAWWVRLRYNRLTFAVSKITSNYLASFGPNFLFLKGGGNHAHNIAGMGNLYLAEAPFFYLGILVLVRNRKHKIYQFLLWWLLISPIASALTKDAPHTNRMFVIYPLPTILTALGLFSITAKKIFRVSLILFSLLLISNFIYYLYRYFSYFPASEAQHWGYGYRKLTEIINSPELNSKKIIISHPETSPYIYYLFYSGYPPALYQQEAVRYSPTNDEFVHVKSFGRFEFRDIDWVKDVREKDVVLVDFSKNVPADIVKQTKIYLPNGEPFLTIKEN